ncbi:MAG: hypothetical protein IT429_05005 [Gemmataceae bacterium]|nr:hypothetical protein [Gemmataceae bacterium]
MYCPAGGWPNEIKVRIAAQDDWPAYQSQRARIVLVIAAAAGCNASTVWRICRLYEQGGLSSLLADGRRTLPEYLRHNSARPHPIG